jgi:4-amino-4-deoxy-L-arabinose transferase-like glycosyltransferase
MQDPQEILPHPASEPRRAVAAFQKPGNAGNGSAMSRDAVAVESRAPKVESPGRQPSPEGAGESKIARSRRVPWLAIALVVGFLLNVAWRLWLVRDIQVPAAHADEDGYLLAARALAGGPGGYSTENTAFRRVGYPFLLAPVYWFTSDPFQVYRGAQLVNALVNSLTFPLAYLFARRVFGQPRSWSLGLGLLVASMPAVVFYSQYAMTDAVLVTFALAWLLLLHTWLTATTGRGRVLAALGASATAGAIYVLHVRGTMVVAVHLFVIVVFAVLRRTSWRLTLAAVVTTALAAAGDKVLQHLLTGEITTVGRSPRGQMVAALTTVHGAANAAARAFGQLWYLVVGTWGLGAIGLVALVMALWPLRDLRERLRERVEGGRLLILLTTLVATLLIAGASSASLPTNDHRINYYAYPRYIHFLFPVWMMAGVVALRLVNGRRLRMLALSAAGVTLFSAGVVYLRLRFNNAWIFLPFDMPETTFLSWQWSAIRVAQPTVAGLVLLGLLVFTLSRSRTVALAMGVVVALHAAVMILSVEKITKPMTVDQYRADTPLLVRDVHLGPGDVVAVSDKTQWYLPWNVMREVYWDRVVMFDSMSEEPPAGANVIIAPYGYTELPGRDSNWNGGPTFHRVAVDDRHHWAVWRKS